MPEIAVVLLLVVVGYGLGRGLRAWLDAARFDWPPLRRLRWSLVAAVAPSRYWWGARVAALPAADRAALLVDGTRALGLEHPAGLRCPLCASEIPGAWVLDATGRVTAAPGELPCPRCDFRLDACRHCTHFLPGGPQSWHSSAWNAPDGTWGRCGYYKRPQPVEDAVDAEMARSLRRQGYDEIRAPVRIVDSMLRPDFCRAFAVDYRRLRQASGIRRPGRERGALLRLAQDNAPPRGDDGGQGVRSK